MRKLPAILLVSILALPAHAGLGSLLRAAGKAGSVADDAARVGVKAGTHVDDAARAATHADDARLGAHMDDGAVVGEDSTVVAKSEDGIAGDVAQEAAGLAVDAASSAGGGVETKNTMELEMLKHRGRVATLDALEVIAIETSDTPLQVQVSRIREKESVRHTRAIVAIVRKP